MSCIGAMDWSSLSQNSGQEFQQLCQTPGQELQLCSRALSRGLMELQFGPSFGPGLRSITGASIPKPWSKALELASRSPAELESAKQSWSFCPGPGGPMELQSRVPLELLSRTPEHNWSSSPGLWSINGAPIPNPGLEPWSLHQGLQGSFSHRSRAEVLVWGPEPCPGVRWSSSPGFHWSFSPGLRSITGASVQDLGANMELLSQTLVQSLGARIEVSGGASIIKAELKFLSGVQNLI